MFVSGLEWLMILVSVLPRLLFLTDFRTSSDTEPFSVGSGKNHHVFLIVVCLQNVLT